LKVIALFFTAMICVMLFLENNTGTLLDDERMRRLAMMTLAFIVIVWVMTPMLYAFSFWSKLILRGK
jgi:hypothetical protein